MANTDAAGSEALEREVAEERVRVEETIGAIQRRLTPGQLIDELTSYAQQTGTGLAANLGKAIRENPIPTALIGVGFLWFILSQTHPANPSADADRPQG
jgi:hypothetical protein